MRIPKDKKYCSSLEEADQYLETIKFVSCPHCTQMGFMIGHGFLKGFDGDSSDRTKRGRRFFCSNRFNRSGCGGTTSLLLSALMKGFCISTGLLWNFLMLVASGASTKSSWESCAGSLPVENGYRLRKKLRMELPRLRTLLCRKESPPFCNSDDPLSQLVLHLNCAFPSSECPLSDFQESFQESVFA